MLPALLKSLLKPEAYPEIVQRVELVQTHVSWIFLTETHAYKIKKPVDFGFLDFSSRDKRRFYCNEEVRLNSRLCPDMYEAVIEVRKAPGGATFFGNGPVIDYAVRMKRLPKEDMLDRLVEHGQATIGDMRHIAGIIADFHRTCATSDVISQYGKLEQIMSNWQENLSQSSIYAKSTLPEDDLQVIEEWVSTFAEKKARVFEERVKHGFIRECDGDIHLENICLTGGKIYIFDCIEFNERFRCCDTAADVAFLLMDLDYHRRNDLAEEVVKEYVLQSGDAGLITLLDFYKVYRAFVRGKVESLLQHDKGIEPETCEQARQRAIRYFRLARGYIERSRIGPTLFITCGMIGTGKSALADQLAFELGIASFSSDKERKRLASILPDTPIRVAFNEGLYSETATRETYAELLRLAETELAKGYSVIVDACFAHRDQRRLFNLLASRHGSRFAILHVTCPENEQRRRLSHREARGSISDGRLDILEPLKNQFQPPGTEEGLLIDLHTVTAPATLTNSIYSRLHQ